VKKSIGALLTIAISVLCVAVAPVSAAPSAVGVPTGALTMRSVDGSPGARGFSITIDPGQAANRRVVITNHSTNLRLTVRLEPIAASALQASWITLSDVVETLEPGAHAVVSARVLVPSNAVPGSVKVKVQARVEHAVLAVDGSAVAGSPSVSLPIAIKVRGAPTAQVSIVNVESITDHGRDFLAIEFQNVGATAIDMQGRVRVATTPPTSYPVDAHVVPLTNTIVRVAWAKPPGAKGVLVAVDTDNARGDQAVWNGTVGAAPPTTVGAPAVHAAAASAVSPIKKRDPFVLGVLGAVALAVLWFLYETVRALRRRRKRRRMLRDVGLIAARSDAQPPNLPVEPNLPVPMATPVAASSDQISAVAAQLGALVGAIEHLTARLDAVRTLPAAAPEPVAGPVPVGSTPIPAPPPPPSTMPVRTPAPPPAVAAVPAVSAEAAVMPSGEDGAMRAFAGASSEPQSTLGDGYPYDWPTSEQLDRFVARRKAAAPPAE
jgi:hypothetical protein